MNLMPCHDSQAANCSGISDAAMPPTKIFSAWPFATFSAKFNTLRDAGELERKQRCDIDAVPRRPKDRGILALDEFHFVALTVRPMVLT
ncbi:MAG: hypothetical protein JO033_04670 [Acidobacteriaceae bacterium]|nr:hypothetical protein [Acidobacteriaceae bacterium]